MCIKQFGIEDDSKESKSMIMSSWFGQICQIIYCRIDDTNLQELWTSHEWEIYKALRDLKFPLYRDFFSKMSNGNTYKILRSMVRLFPA